MMSAVFEGALEILVLVRRFVTPWTVACQAPLSMGFSSQEYWSGLSFPPPGIFLTQESNSRLLHWQADSLPLSHLAQRLLQANETPSNPDLLRQSGKKSVLGRTHWLQMTDPYLDQDKVIPTWV